MEKVQILESVETNCAKMTLRSDGIIRTEIVDNYDLEIDDARKLMDGYLKLGKGRKTPHLIVFKHMSMADRAVMKFMAEEANNFGKADAIVIDSKAQKILADFYILVQRPKVPTRFFTLEEDAIEWLHSQAESPE
jgi:hypothetical protein